jgi:DMSO/TMAO reductase YedYZ molybdopterin-dependent catalytic subunit
MPAFPAGMTVFEEIANKLSMIKRRDFLRGLAGGATIGVGGGLILSPAGALAKSLPTGLPESSLLEALPGKKPLIKRTYRPPNFETPLGYFNELFTPNDAFYVRYHLSNIPRLNAQEWKLEVGGESLEKTLEFTLDDLKRGFEQVELAAVNQCSGNRRGLVQPRVPGLQWGYGAMGNALWRGVRLREILKKAGLKQDALEVLIDGADGGAIGKPPDFAKSLPIAKALDENTLIALEMNGDPLPHWKLLPSIFEYGSHLTTLEPRIFRTTASDS